MKNNKSEDSQVDTTIGNQAARTAASSKEPVENFQTSRGDDGDNQYTQTANDSSSSGPNLSQGNPSSGYSNDQDVSSSTHDRSVAQLAEMLADLQRTRADFENFRKQADLQKSQAMAAARYATVQKFLPLIDDFSRAIDTYPEQLAPLAKSLQKLLQSLQLSTIDSAPGTEFSPDLHEAISMEDGDGMREIISETLRPGYIYEGSVIRPAMVKVTHSE